jgi:hypothetical protein
MYIVQDDEWTLEIAGLKRLETTKLTAVSDKEEIEFFHGDLCCSWRRWPLPCSLSWTATNAQSLPSCTMKMLKQDRLHCLHLRLSSCHHQVSPSAFLLRPHANPSIRTGPPPAPIYLTSTQDLLARFNLLPSYDKYVRPYVTAVGHDHPPTPTPIPDIKGKGKEKEVASPAAAQSPGDDHDQDHDDDGDGPGGKGEKKKKNNYKHLIKGVPGAFGGPFRSTW